VDDVTTVGNSFDQKLSKLQRVFEQLNQAGLKVHIGKCQFLQQDITFLSHVISHFLKPITDMQSGAMANTIIKSRGTTVLWSGKILSKFVKKLYFLC